MQRTWPSEITIHLPRRACRYIAGFDMAVFWDNAASGADDQKLTATSEAHRFNPVEIGLRWL